MPWVVPPMRIAFICRSLGIGGAERQLALLAKGLAGRGHNVTIIEFYDDGMRIDDFAASNVRLVSLAKRGRYHAFGPLFALWRELRRIRPHIVHGYVTVPNIVSLAALALRPRPKIVWGLRSSDMEMSNYDWLNRVTYRLEGTLLRFADLVIVNSGAGLTRAQQRGAPIGKLTMIHNGVDTALFQPNPAARSEVRRSFGIDDLTMLIGHVARVDPMKDHQSFLKAIALIARHRSNLRALCVAAGKNEELDNLRHDVTRLGLDGVVTITGGTLTIERTLPAFDLMCLSSRFGEGLPNVVLEAMSCGIPCVVTAVGDAPELVGSSGAVARPGDPAHIASTIEALIQRLEAEGTALQDANRARAQHFSIDALVIRTEQALLDVRGAVHNCG